MGSDVPFPGWEHVGERVPAFPRGTSCGNPCGEPSDQVGTERGTSGNTGRSVCGNVPPPIRGDSSPRHPRHIGEIVTQLERECPTCASQPGQLCTRLDGEVMPNLTHPSRASGRRVRHPKET